MAGVGYGFCWGRVILGYRHLGFDQGDSSPVGKLSMSGAEAYSFPPRFPLVSRDSHAGSEPQNEHQMKKTEEFF